MGLCPAPSRRHWGGVSGLPGSPTWNEGESLQSPQLPASQLVSSVTSTLILCSSGKFLKAFPSSLEGRIH